MSTSAKSQTNALINNSKNVEAELQDFDLIEVQRTSWNRFLQTDLKQILQ